MSKASELAARLNERVYGPSRSNNVGGGMVMATADFTVRDPLSREAAALLLEQEKALQQADDDIKRLKDALREAREGNHTSSENEPTWAELTDFWKKRAEALEAESAMLREALEFYAREWNWESIVGDSPTLIDGGNIAREALGKE